MATTQLTNHVWPEDDGTGAADGNEDWDSAGFIGGMHAKDHATDYVETGLNFEGDGSGEPDYTVPDFDLSAGLAFIKYTGQVDVQALADGAYTDTWDHGMQLAVHVDAQTGISLTDAATNHIYLAVDLTSNDGAYVEVNTTGTAPSDPHIKLGEIDTANDTKVETNRGPRFSDADSLHNIKFVDTSDDAGDVEAKSTSGDILWYLPGTHSYGEGVGIQADTTVVIPEGVTVELTGLSSFSQLFKVNGGGVTFRGGGRLLGNGSVHGQHTQPINAHADGDLVVRDLHLEDGLEGIVR